MKGIPVRHYWIVPDCLAANHLALNRIRNDERDKFDGYLGATTRLRKSDRRVLISTKTAINMAAGARCETMSPSKCQINCRHVTSSLTKSHEYLCRAISKFVQGCRCSMDLLSTSFVMSDMKRKVLFFLGERKHEIDKSSRLGRKMCLRRIESVKRKSLL